MVAGGLAALPHVTGLLAVMVIMGVLLPAGTGVLAFGLVMGVVSHRMTRAQSTSASGVVTASAGIVGTVLSPAIASLLAALGHAGALTVLAVPALAAIPVIVWMFAVGLRGAAMGPDGADAVAPPERPDADPAPEELLEAVTAPGAEGAPERPVLRDLLRRAFRDRGYLIIFTAFFTCGFHMAIIETHLVSQMQHDGMTASGAAAGFAAYGVAAMIGPVIAGWLCGRFPMRIVLAGTYASRALIVAVFFALPTSSATLVGFAILLGLTGNSTVPPTSGIIEERFGAASLGTLFGAAFLCHQLGAFVSAWLGGVTATATGGYGLIWTLASVLSIAAAVGAWFVPERD